MDGDKLLVAAADDPGGHKPPLQCGERLGDSVGRFNKAVVLCEHRQFEAAVDTDFIEDFRQVVLDRIFTDTDRTQSLLSGRPAMIRIPLVSIFLLSSLAPLAAQPAAQPAATPKTAVIDLAKVMSKYDKQIEVKKKFDEELVPLKAQAEKIKAALEKAGAKVEVK